MKFAHLADCHIGSWRDQKMRDLGTLSFFKAVEICLNEKVDFALISGDLFNTAVPGIENIKDVVRKFKELKDSDIPVYIIPGSHDFSPSGKTMLDVLEEAGLCKNVVRGKAVNNKLMLEFTIDKKTNAKITGMLGRRGMLEKSYYNELDRESLEDETGFKIFMFHTSITELKPKKLEKMESSPISLLPKGFDYYAGGHVHIVEKKDLPGYTNVIYPGPLFPNSFSELEELKHGGFYIYDDGEIKRHEIELKKVFSISIDAGHKIPERVYEEIINDLKGKALSDNIVLIRLFGTLEDGKPSDIDFKRIYEYLYEKNAYFVMRSTSMLSGREFEEIKVSEGPSDEIEEKLISEHIGQARVSSWSDEKEKAIIKSLMAVLSSEKKEGEKVYEFEARIISDADRLIGI